MIMADVFAVFGTLLAVGIALPGMLLTWQLLFPKLVNRSQQRLTQTPWKSFFMGLLVMAIYLIPVAILFMIPGNGGQIFGFMAIFGLMAFAGLGAAALAKILGQQLQDLGLKASAAGAAVRGAIALELAAVFPFIGWFFFIPIALLISLGAASFALLGWMPGQKTPASAPAQGIEEATATA